jgi:2-phospho-L-lactate guanylyltransferase (CobY/MobA/RfbA family)
MSQLSAQGLPLRFIENERLALDIDEPKDLERFLSFGFEDGESTRAVRAMLADQVAEKNRGIGVL